MHHNQKQPKRLLEDLQRPLNDRTTTVSWLNKQNKDVAEQRLTELVEHNVSALERLIRYVGSLPPELRLVRISSGILPVYTHSDWNYFYRVSDRKTWLERKFSNIGTIARELDVRLSMHPGQFCVLASDNPDIVTNSIEEFEYHADMIRWMGYGQKFQDFKCNVHISGRLGPDGIVQAYKKLSPEARNTITIENDENSWGLDASLQLPSYIPLVLDIHHHFVREGEYIHPTDDRFKRIIDTWQGIRPVIHYSYSRDEHLPQDFKHDTMPDMQQLLESGCKKAKLRAHSDYYPNSVVNDWALTFLEYSDIMCESKMKNLASAQLYAQTTHNNIAKVA
jgi:UV damage endonuclease UvdE